MRQLEKIIEKNPLVLTLWGIMAALAIAAVIPVGAEILFPG
jgi:hypothetical protein